MIPNSDTNVSLMNRDENREDILEMSPYGPLTLNKTDDELASIIHTKVEDAERFWEDKLQLSTVREQNEQAYLGLREDPEELYDYQFPYKNNRLITAVETLIPLATSQVPEPVVTEANDTDASRELAKNLKMALLALYEDLYLKANFEMVGRHLLLGYRLGVMKYAWDGTLGRIDEKGERTGGIIAKTIRPQRIVVEARTLWEDMNDIPLIGEYQAGTVEDLVMLYPDKTDEIYKEFGASNKKEPVMSSPVGYIHIWFSYYEGKKKQEGFVCKYKNLILDKMKNPHYNYEEYGKDDKGDLVYNNFFDRPRKPYIFFNHINLGRFIFDDTSLMEQAIPQQDILMKRGRQIVENADMANSGLVVNAEMIKEDDVAKLIGDPDEKLMVTGDVRAAAARLPQNLLPDYVLQDKYDARNEIDNIFGTTAPVRGEKSDAKTLGQEIISQRSNISRMKTLTESLERGATGLYQGLVQMMKVFWDEPTMVKYTGRDGYTTHMEFSQDKIEDGIQVRVKAGSLLPRDEITERDTTIQLAATLDPLSLAEGIGKRDPQEFAKRIVYYQFAMDRYMSEILNVGADAVDRDAVSDINLINTGHAVPVREEPSKEYLSTYASYLESETFSKLDPSLQQKHIEFIKATKDKAMLDIKQEAPEEGEAADAMGAMTPGAVPPMEGMEEGMSPQVNTSLNGALPPSPFEKPV